MESSTAAAVRLRRHDFSKQRRRHRRDVSVRQSVSVSGKSSTQSVTSSFVYMQPSFTPRLNDGCN